MEKATLTLTQARSGTHSAYLVHALWLGAFALLAAPTLVFLWDKWTRNIWLSGHGLFMPLVVAFLAYYALLHEPVKREEPNRWGFAILVPAVFLVALDSAIKTELLSAVALILALPGFSLLLLGAQRTRALLFPWLLSFFMLPIPSAFLVPIHHTLRWLSIVGTEEVLHFLGLPVVSEGMYLHLPHGTFHVVEECSGFMALYAALTIALVLAYMADSWKRRIVLLLVPWPLAYACNVLRLVVLAIVAEEWGHQVLKTPIHVLSGYLTFSMTLGALFLFADYSHRRAPV